MTSDTKIDKQRIDGPMIEKVHEKIDECTDNFVIDGLGSSTEGSPNSPRPNTSEPVVQDCASLSNQKEKPPKPKSLRHTGQICGPTDDYNEMVSSNTTSTII